MQPDTRNFETLADAYGVVGGTAPQSWSATSNSGGGGNSAATASPRSSGNTGTGGQPPKRNEKKGGHRGLRGKKEPSIHSDVVVPAASVQRALLDVMTTDKEVVVDAAFLNQHRVLIDRGWRVLGESRHGRSLEVELSEGFTAQLHFLFAADHS